MSAKLFGFIYAAVSLICQVACSYKCWSVSKGRFLSWCSWRGKTPDQSEVADVQTVQVAEEPAKLVRKRRLYLAKRVSLALWVFLAVVGVQITVEPFVPTMYHDPLALPRTLTLVVITPPCLIERILNKDAFAKLATWLLMACFCFHGAVRRDGLMAGFSSAGLNFTSLIASSMYLDFRSLLLPHVCLTVCLILGVSSDGSAESKEFANPIIAVEVLMLLFRLLLVGIGHYSLWALTSAEVGRDFEQKQQSAALALLRMMCDAIVELDETFSLKEHSPGLATMLLHGSGRCLKGQPLSDFIADEADRNRLHIALGQGSPSMSPEASFSQPPSMLSLSLSDSTGARINATMYLLPFVSVGSEIRYLVGLREETDDGQQKKHLVDAMPEGELRPEQEQRLLTWSESKGAPSRSYTSATASAPSDADNDEVAPGSLDVEVGLQPGMPIKCMPRDFKREFGLAGDNGHQFSSLVGPGDPEEDGDGGSQLLLKIQRTMVYEQSSSRAPRRCVRCIGEWDMLARAAGASDGPVGIVRRTLWVTFRIPFGGRDPSLLSVTISLSSGTAPAAAGGGGDANKDGRTVFSGSTLTAGDGMAVGALRSGCTTASL